MSKKIPRFEAIVVNAIRRLQVTQGSTANEIANYLQCEYNVSGPEIRRHINQTIRRGLNYGILEKSNRGYTTCDRSIFQPLETEVRSNCYNCRATNKRRRIHIKRNYHRGNKKNKSRKRNSRKRRPTITRHTRSKKTSKANIIPFGRQPPNKTNQGRSNSKSPAGSSSDDKRET